VKRALPIVCLVGAAFAASAAVVRQPLERVASMDPIRAAAVYDAKAVALVYEAPLEVDYAARPYRLKAGFFEWPSVSEDGLVYTFRRAAVRRFTDDPCFPGGKGPEATAYDAAWSLKRLGDPANASCGLWIMDGVKTVEALDADTLRVTLKAPSHVFPWLMAMPQAGVVSEAAVKHYGARFGSVAVGTGAYRLASWRRNHAMSFERNADWPGWSALVAGGEVYDGVVYDVVDDASTQWLMFLAGEVDFLGEIARDNWDAVVRADGTLDPALAVQGVKLVSAPALQTLYIGFNMKDPVVGPNKKLRQALNCAFDFPAWQRFYNGRVMPSNGPVPDGVEGKSEAPFAYAFDLEKAKKLLAEAGYADGIDPKTGRRLVLTMSIGRASQAAREQAELLAAFYEKIGVKLEAAYFTWDAFLKAVNEGRVQMFQMGWVGDYPDAENFLQLFHSKNLAPGANHTFYVEPAFDAAYDAAMAAKTAEARNAAWCRAQEIVCEDCPWIFLHYPKAYTLYRDTTEGYVPGDFTYGGEKYLRPVARKDAP